MEITEELRKELWEKYRIIVCVLHPPKPIKKANKKSIKKGTKK